MEKRIEETEENCALDRPSGKCGSGNLANIMLVNCYLSDCCQQSDNVGHFTFARYFKQIDQQSNYLFPEALMITFQGKF